MIFDRERTSFNFANGLGISDFYGKGTLFLCLLWKFFARERKEKEHFSLKCYAVKGRF